MNSQRPPNDVQDTPRNKKAKRVAWYKRAPHLPDYALPKTCKLISKKSGMPPHVHAYWTSKGHEQKLAMKQFVYVMNNDQTYKMDADGKAEVKSGFNGIELDPMDALRAIKVWKEMLAKEGYTDEDLSTDELSD